MIRRLLHILKDSYLYNSLWHLVLRIKIALYNARLNTIQDRIRQKDRINVLFFAVSVGMWKYDKVFSLMLSDKRYNPYIVSFIYPHEVPAERRSKQEQLKQYFLQKGYPFIESYDATTDKWLTNKNLFPSPDIVIYAQPYNTGQKHFKIEQYWRKSLFIYAPYCLMIEKSESLYNTLLCNIAWKVFCNSPYEKKLLSQLMFNHGDNLYVSGYLAMDTLSDSSKERNYIWHDKSHTKKRVIWAPHHSIRKEDLLNYGTFLDSAEFMQHIAKKYSTTIEWAFKPHPMLRNKLYQHPSWGREKTDAYYSWWNTQPNTMMREGEYAELFASSDALIHDCSSFMGEYLYTGKPVLYLEKDGHTDMLNSFGKACLELHYKASHIKDIETFIQNVLIQELDSMKDTRADFKENFLIQSSQHTVAENIKNEIDSLFE